MINFNKMPYFQFRGRRSNEFNMVIRHDMEFVLPETTLDFTEVDGRSSDIIFDRGRLKDIEKTFPVRIYKESDTTIAAQLRNIAGWLYLSHEYLPLLFSGYGEYYYKALGYKTITIKDESKNWVDVDFTFKCQPYVFRLDGEDERDVSSGQSITNPELFTSLPIVTLNKTSSATDSNIYINGQQFRIAKEAGIGIITMDCENGIAYKEGGVNVSKQCFLNTEGYHPLILQPGKNEISYTNINQFKIKPRWRNLAI
ncbi:phage tail protein [Enterococcus sp. 22-H-5-01]|uniref:phage tail protein n=1 Tax=Enterococcus sp. 22-H-5-01 TaxID=3418555 RepID=UPI003D037ECB